MRKLLAIALCMLIHASYTNADYTVLPDAKTVGTARHKVLFWDIYDAELKAPNGRWTPDTPYTLTLHYLREIEGEMIADISVEEIRKLGFTDEIKLATWHKEMRQIFPDVDKETKLTGLYSPQGATHFYQNNQHIGMIQDPDFGEWFFGIWLDENTSEPEVRQQLLGLK